MATSIIEYKHPRTGRRLLAVWRAGLKRLDYLDHPEVYAQLETWLQ